MEHYAGQHCTYASTGKCDKSMATTNERTKLIAKIRNLEEKGPLVKPQINNLVLNHLENVENLTGKYNSAYEHDIWISKDLIGGAMLTKIFYWEIFQPPEILDKIQLKEGKQWIAIKFKEWAPIYITPSQARSRYDLLVQEKLIIPGHLNWARGRERMVPHLRLNFEVYLNKIFEYIDQN
jgi:hypothetical protein